MKPDSIDRQILELVSQKPDISENEIALKLGLGTNEVKKRIRHFSDTREKIMIVDDEKDLVSLLKLSFESENYGVVEAYNGHEALEKTRTEVPDLILLDISLPGIDGYEVCKRLRKDPATESIPIIMLTGKDEVSDKIEGLERGADDYVTKPFDINELKARVRTVLRRRSRG